MVEGTGPLFQQGQVVQRIKDILPATIAAGMAGNHLLSVEQLHPKRIHLDRQLAIRLIGGHGVAIGLKDHLAVRVQADEVGDATLEIVGGQRPQVRLLPTVQASPIVVGCPVTWR